MKTIDVRVALPIVVNDYLLQIAMKNRREGKGPRNKEEIIKEVMNDYFITNNK